MLDLKLACFGVNDDTGILKINEIFLFILRSFVRTSSAVPTPSKSRTTRSFIWVDSYLSDFKTRPTAMRLSAPDRVAEARVGLLLLPGFRQ